MLTKFAQDIINGLGHGAVGQGAIKRLEDAINHVFMSQKKHDVLDTLFDIPELRKDNWRTNTTFNITIVSKKVSQIRMSAVRQGWVMYCMDKILPFVLNTPELQDKVRYTSDGQWLRLFHQYNKCIKMQKYKGTFDAKAIQSLQIEFDTFSLYFTSMFGEQAVTNYIHF